MPTAREDAVRLADLLRREHHALAEFLVALAAFDHERRWVDLGHRSLFYFLTRELDLPKGPAYYRMTAASLVQKFPELVEPLRDGRLHLTSIVELSKVLTPENLPEVLPRFFHASKREAQEVRAELLPAAAPPMRTVATALPAVVDDVTSAAAFTVGAVLPEEPRACQVSVPDVVPPPARRSSPTKAEPLTAELTRLHVTVSRRLLDKLAAARDALSHSHPNASDDEILELGLDLIVDRHRKRRGIGAKPRKPRSTGEDAAASAPPSAPPPPEGRSRYAPPSVWRAVWERDGGKCAWPLEGGGVCGSTRRLQLDHVDGFALGAATTVDACRLTCDFHNDLGARDLYGDGLMNRYTTPKRAPRCSEPVATYGSYSPRIGHPCATTTTSWPGWRARSSAAYSSARATLRVPQTGGSIRSSGVTTAEVQAGSPSTVTWKTCVAKRRACAG